MVYSTQGAKVVNTFWIQYREAIPSLLIASGKITKGSIINSFTNELFIYTINPIFDLIIFSDNNLI